MSHTAGWKPVYSAWRRIRPPSVCRKLFRLVIYESIKDRIILGNADIKTDVITEGNRAQVALWTVHGKCPVWMSSSPPPPEPPNAESIPRLSKFTVREGILNLQYWTSRKFKRFLVVDVLWQTDWLPAVFCT